MGQITRRQHLQVLVFYLKWNIRLFGARRVKSLLIILILGEMCDNYLKISQTFCSWPGCKAKIEDSPYPVGRVSVIYNFLGGLPSLWNLLVLVDGKNWIYLVYLLSILIFDSTNEFSEKISSLSCTSVHLHDTGSQSRDPSYGDLHCVHLT